MTGPVSANPHRETVRVEGAYRGPKPTKASAYGQRTLQDDTTTRQQRLVHPELERVKCPECLKMVTPRSDGTLKAHNSSPGISCVAAQPRVAQKPPAQCEKHGDFRTGTGSLIFTCGCPAPRLPRRKAAG